MTKEEIKLNIRKDGQIKSSFLAKNNLTRQNCFDILHGKKYCKYCNNLARFINFIVGYDDICDNKECVKKRRHERTVKTNLEKYGVENVSQLKEIQERKEKTLFEHYGVRDYLNSEFNKKNMYKNGVHVTMTPEVKERRKQTLLNKYNTLDTFSLNDGHAKANSKEGRQKAKETLKQNYNVTSTFALEKTKESIKKTCLEHFGVESAAKSEIVKNKVKETCLKKYGKLSFLQTPEYKEKAKKTNLEKYGSEYYLSSEARRKLFEELGYQNLAENIMDYDKYARQVWKYTNKQDLKSLKNFDKRGITSYHVDHKFSIFEGFKRGILPSIIGDISNLEMLPYKDNTSKGKNCSKTEEQLFNDYLKGFKQ